MLKGKQMRKGIALFLLVLMLTNLLAPTVSYALTSGPTQPEATSFEPIDTTDMVNLQTGDFTYNIPLLEVPGPEGGYPLSLSYHAGIQPNEDASWVGLGWTINPGAINRSVNGYPDDWYNPTNSNHVYWSGGITNTWDAGVSIGIGGGAGVNYGLSFSQDTYQGFGVGFSVGIGLAIGGSSSPFGIGVGVGITPYGETYMTAGLKITGSGEANLQASAGIGFSTNFESLNSGVSGGISYSNGTPNKRSTFSGSLLGASISTSGDRPSFEIAGLTSNIASSKDAGIRTSSSGWGFATPTPFISVYLGHRKTRYWTDEKSNTQTHGSLYSSGWPIADNVAYDTYSLLEDPESKSIVNYADPTKVQGGSFMNFDTYSVNAQGLGGSMRPYLLRGEILGQNRRNNENVVLTSYYSPGNSHLMPQFRFEGDFSNSFRQSYIDYSANDLSLDLRTLPPPIDENPVFGDNDGTYSFANNKLAGSKNVQIGVTVQPSNIQGYFKTDRYKPHMIDGFSITNESGVTYHYALPAYTWGEESYQEKISRDNGLSFNRQTKGEAYAYTWYLTTITGPDFVDRDADGKAGNSDWGYWINFEYGKWSNNYVWRNPSEAYHKDDDNEWQNCSIGIREVYYLNAIRTRSHLALFEKDIRNDSKGASPESFNANTSTTLISLFPLVTGTLRKDYQNQGVYNTNSSQSLKLSKIYLFDINNSPTINTYSGISGAFYPSPMRSIVCDCENARYVIDKTDVDEVGRLNLEEKALRIIDFDYDYSLCDQTTNSFDINTPTIKSGKLTLNSVLMRGKGGTSLLPPIKFYYELDTEEKKYQSGVTWSPPWVFSYFPSSFSTTNSEFEKGDLIMQEGQPAIYLGAIIDKTFSGGVYTYYMNNGKKTGSTASVNVYTTKNPPYNKDAYDSWGMYKSDIKPTIMVKNENLARQCSNTSSKSLDVWSLRKVKTSLGNEVNIAYEADSYSKSILNTNNSFILKNLSILSDKKTIDFDIEDYGFPIDELNLGIGRKYRIQFLIAASSVAGIIKVTHVSDLLITNINANHITGILETEAPIPITFEGIVTGNLSLQLDRDNFGGGLKVSRIQVSDHMNQSITYSYYNYSNPYLSSGQSSGITTFSPCTLDFMDVDAAKQHPSSSDEFFIKEYKVKLYKDFNSLYVLSRELPAPGVMYQYVTVHSEVKNLDESNRRVIEGKTQYEFEVFRENMISREVLSTKNGILPYDPDYYILYQVSKNIVIKKFTNSIGNIRSVIKFDKFGKKMSETTNHYLHDGLENLSPGDFMNQYKSRIGNYNYQGFVQERNSEVKIINNVGFEFGLRATLTGREEYPCIQTGQTVTDYVSNKRVKTENIGFDFYSGSLTRSVETDTYGNRYMTEIIPAYRKYSSMGLKVNDGYNKNMLTQVAATYSYKVDVGNTKLGLVSAGVQTWGNDASVLDADGNSYVQDSYSSGDVWRMRSSFSWLPVDKPADGMTSLSGFADFNWASPSSSDARWKKTSEIMLYDVYSKSLEQKDINGNVSAIRMNYGDKKVILSGSDANFYELAFGNVEDASVEKSNTMFVRKGDGVISSDAAHTGLRSLKLGAGGKNGFIYEVNTNRLTTGRPYTASVWVKPVTGSAHDLKLYYEIDNVEKASSVSSSSIKTANGWTLLTLSVAGADIAANKVLKVGCRNDHGTSDIYVDDLRFQPLTSGCTAYVYDPFSGELNYILDNNNLYTKFEYDAAGRLIKTFREKIGKPHPMVVSEYQYNFGVTKFLSDPINTDYYSANCPQGMTSLPFSITFPQGKCISYVSLLDANNQAQALAQNKANNEGGCYYPPGTYVKFEVTDGPIYENGCDFERSYIYALRFYSDMAGTMPLSVSDLTVNLVLYEHSFANGIVSTPVSFVCNGTSQVIDTNVGEYYNTCGSEFFFEYYNIVPGDGYTTGI